LPEKRLGKTRIATVGQLIRRLQSLDPKTKIYVGQGYSRTTPSQSVGGYRIKAIYTRHSSLLVEYGDYSTIPALPSAPWAERIINRLEKRRGACSVARHCLVSAVEHGGTARRLPTNWRTLYDDFSGWVRAYSRPDDWPIRYQRLFWPNGYLEPS